MARGRVVSLTGSWSRKKASVGKLTKSRQGTGFRSWWRPDIGFSVLTDVSWQRVVLALRETGWGCTGTPLTLHLSCKAKIMPQMKSLFRKKK